MSADAWSRHESIRASKRPLSVVVGDCDCLLGITVILPFVGASRAHSALLPPRDSIDECSEGHAKNDNSYYAAAASGRRV